MPHVKGFDSLTILRSMQLGKKNDKTYQGVATYFHSHLNPNLSQWKERSHDSYPWLWVNKGVAPNLFVFVVYVAHVGSKYENESLLQNLVVDFV